MLIKNKWHCPWNGYGGLSNLADAMHACIYALQFASDAGMGWVVLETDATVLKLALVSNEHDWSRHGVILRDSKFILLTSIIVFKVVCCNCGCNLLADTLAANGAYMDPDATDVWL